MYSDCNTVQLLQMQKVNEDCSMDDDMVDGDLGFGMGARVPPSPIRRKTQSFRAITDSVVSRAERFRHNSQTSAPPWFPGPKTTETQCRAQWRLSQSGSYLLNTGVNHVDLMVKIRHILYVFHVRLTFITGQAEPLT